MKLTIDVCVLFLLCSLKFIKRMRFQRARYVHAEILIFWPIIVRIFAFQVQVLINLPLHILIELLA